MLNFPDQVTAVRVRSGGSVRLEKKGRCRDQGCRLSDLVHRRDTERILCEMTWEKCLKGDQTVQTIY